MASHTQTQHHKKMIPTLVKELTRHYTELTEEYNKISETLVSIRESRKQIERQLVHEIMQNGLSGYGITYNGNKISLTQDTTYDALTYKFLEECLVKLYLGDCDKAKKVITFIKKQRTFHVEKNIKISGPAEKIYIRSRPNTPSQ